MNRPGPLRRFLRHERRVLGCLVRALARRPDLPPGATPVRYAAAATPFLGGMLAVSVIELAVPWAWLRYPLLVLGV